MTLGDYKRRCYGKHKNDLAQWHQTRAIAYSFYRTMGGKDPISKFMPLSDDAPVMNNKNVEWAKQNIQKIKAAYNASGTKH